MRRVIVSAAVGVVHAAIVASVHFIALPVTRVGDAGTAAVVVGNALALTGLVLVGAVATLVLLRYGLVLPGVLLLWLTWQSASDHLIGQGMEPFTTFYYNPITPLLALGLLCLIAAIEFAVRDRLPICAPRPLL